MSRRSTLAKIDFTYTGQRIAIIIALITVCFSSCKKNKQKDDAVKIVAEWTGKEIKFPKGIPCTSMGKDTTCVDLYSNSYKILLYVDSLGCTSCRLKFPEWKKIISESDSAFSIAAITAFNVNVSTQEEGLSDISLKNVEALALEQIPFTPSNYQYVNCSYVTLSFKSCSCTGRGWSYCG